MSIVMGSGLDLTPPAGGGGGGGGGGDVTTAQLNAAITNAKAAVLAEIRGVVSEDKDTLQELVELIKGSNREPFFDLGIGMPITYGPQGPVDNDPYPGQNNPDPKPGDFYYDQQNSTLWQRFHNPEYSYPDGTYLPPDYNFEPVLDENGQPVIITVPAFDSWNQVFSLPTGPTPPPPFLRLQARSNSQYYSAGGTGMPTYDDTYDVSAGTLAVAADDNRYVQPVPNSGTTRDVFLKFTARISGAALGRPLGEVFARLVIQSQINGAWQTTGYGGADCSAFVVGGVLSFTSGPLNGYGATRYGVEVVTPAGVAITFDPYLDVWRS